MPSSENRPSAGGALCTGLVAGAAPDGYTLLFAASSMISADAAIAEAQLRPDERQLVPITNMGTGTQMIARSSGSLPVDKRCRNSSPMPRPIPAS